MPYEEELTEDSGMDSTKTLTMDVRLRHVERRLNQGAIQFTVLNERLNTYGKSLDKMMMILLAVGGFVMANLILALGSLIMSLLHK